jgi:protein-ribulosamine 3-kinase
MASVVLSSFLQHFLEIKLNINVSSFQLIPLSGGSINQSYKIVINQKQYFFCKINSAEKFPLLFYKEKNGLELLATKRVIRAPTVIACQETGTEQILILEWIDQGLKTENFWENFGEQLAALHKITSSTGDSHAMFGLHEDNYMGSLYQSNLLTENWVDFFIHQRLQPQIKLAVDNNLLAQDHIRHFENLFKILSSIFPPEQPSLLHGDLWSGNFLTAQNDQPVLIDPAVYFGHRSIDLAMTTIFGGFEHAFYESYNYHFPFPQNYRLQWDICNLYPLLIHLNLFGESYLHEIVETIRRY